MPKGKRPLAVPLVVVLMASGTDADQIPVIVSVEPAAPPNKVVKLGLPAISLQMTREVAHGTPLRHEGIGFQLAADAV
jgi:hypothetical protein